MTPNKEFLFSSEYSLGQSILTLEDTLDISSGPVSIIAIAKKHNLPYINLVDTSMSGFISAYENTTKHGIRLRFGYKVCVCSDINDKSDNSFNTESNVIIWCLNDKGYADLVKISTLAACDGFYYIPRIDWRSIKELWTENLALSFPFYSSFLYKNNLRHKALCSPDFGFTVPAFHIEDHSLPFDPHLAKIVNEYCKNTNYQVIPSHTCYYYKPEDMIKHQVFRCISSRTKFDKPNLEYYSVDTFSFLSDERTPS